MLQETEENYEKVGVYLSTRVAPGTHRAMEGNSKHLFRMYIKTHITRNYFLDQNNTKVVLSEVKKFVPEVKIVIPPKVDKKLNYCIAMFSLINGIEMHVGKQHKGFEIEETGFYDADYFGGDNIHETQDIKSYVTTFGDDKDIKEVKGTVLKHQIYSQTFDVDAVREGLDTAIVVDLGERKDRQGKPKNDLSISFKTNMPELFKGTHSLKIIMEHQKTTS